MSRFDEFAKSRAQGRGLFGAWRRVRSTTVVETEAGVSRRDLIKKAGLVGGAAVVGSTLIQSVTAPAFAVSGLTCGDPADTTRGCGSTCGSGHLCPNNSDCNNDADCSSGNCTNNICTAVSTEPIANGAACGPGTQSQKDGSCVSGYCNTSENICRRPPANVAAGGTCHGATAVARDANCDPTSGTTCVGGRCLVPDNGPCTSDAVCKSGTCANLTGLCKASSGATCALASECASGVCSGNTCL